MQASPTSAGCEEEGLVVCRGGHIGGQPGTHTLQPSRSLAQYDPVRSAVAHSNMQLLGMVQANTIQGWHHPGSVTGSCYSTMQQ